MNLQFGSGVLYGIPNAGNLAANPTPTKFGILQEASVEFKADLKKLYGQKQFAVATARGKIDVTGKCKIALLDPNGLNQLYFGQTAATGLNRLVIDESHTPAVSVPVTGVSTFARDYGVINGDTGLNMKFIPTGTPVAGQYTQSAGTYVFASAETASTVRISYMETDTAGATITINNQLMGYAPEFRALLANTFRGKYFALELNSCTMGQVSFPSKQDDFWIVDATFDANCDATDTLGSIYADTV
jgi:hypothetical protein